MTPIDVLIAIPFVALASMLWGSVQTEKIRKVKAYRRDNSDLWVETTTKVATPTYPDLWEPILSDKNKGG